MPELPEVETARRLLHAQLINKTLVQVDSRLPKLMRDSPIPNLTLLIGQALIDTRRRAKVLMLDFDGGLSLLIHLKLAGQVAVFAPDGSRHVAGHPIPKPDGPYPHSATHFDFLFSDGTLFYFSDVRQFGWLRLMPFEDVDAAIAAFRFGPEGTTNLLPLTELGTVMQRRGIPIKTLLLDQTFIAGLGNIYVDEALFDARIHPERPASSLTKPERTRVLTAVPIALAEGLRQGGATIINTRAFPIDNFPAVHAREGEACFVCSSIIKKIRVGQRGTYFCPKCQPAKRKRIPRVGAGKAESRPKIDIGTN
ncbi:MAG: DNA-formamidopyrimidine glycosylase [Thermomicrobiales bacterium]